MSATVTSRDLIRMSPSVGNGYRLINPPPAASEPVMRGAVRFVQMRPGLFAHSSNVQDLYGMSVQVELTRQLNVVLALDGFIDVSFDRSRLNLRVESGRGQRAEGALVSLPDATLFTRRSYRGKRERKVSVSVDANWLEASGLDAAGRNGVLADFTGGRFSITRWKPSAKAIALAEQIHHPPPYSLPLTNLYLESRAIELLTEALLAATGQDGVEATALRPRDELRMRELRAFLDSDAALDMSLDTIAAHVGSNPSTLQRNFRIAFGTTVFEYLRERNFQRAREALERGGISVAEAAALAGYGSAANFATAYRRRFGITPKQSRAWV